MNTPFDLHQRVAVVTGAAGNLGLACAQVLHALGARVVLIDRGRGRLPAALLADTDRVLALEGLDLGDAAALTAAVAATDRRFGGADALIHTAGGFRAGSTVDRAPEADWTQMLAQNLGSAAQLCRAFVPGMVEHGSGRLVFVAAKAALHAGPGQAPYAASKAALLRLMEALAAEHAAQGLRANAVIPGTLDTPQNRAAMPSADPSGWVKPESLAQVIAFLVSDAAADINGVALPVYGRS